MDLKEFAIKTFHAAKPTILNVEVIEYVRLRRTVMDTNILG